MPVTLIMNFDCHDAPHNYYHQSWALDRMHLTSTITNSMSLVPVVVLFYSR